MQQKAAIFVLSGFYHYLHALPARSKFCTRTGKPQRLAPSNRRYVVAVYNCTRKAEEGERRRKKFKIHTKRQANKKIETLTKKPTREEHKKKTEKYKISNSHSHILDKSLTLSNPSPFNTHTPHSFLHFSTFGSPYLSIQAKQKTPNTTPKPTREKEQRSSDAEKINGKSEKIVFTAEKMVSVQAICEWFPPETDGDVPEGHECGYCKDNRQLNENSKFTLKPH